MDPEYLDAAVKALGDRGIRFTGGLDLPSYLFEEFKVPNPYPVPEEAREIEFWGEMERLNR